MKGEEGGANKGKNFFLTSNMDGPFSDKYDRGGEIEGLSNELL